MPDIYALVHASIKFICNNYAKNRCRTGYLGMRDIYALVITDNEYLRVCIFANMLNARVGCSGFRVSHPSRSSRSARARDPLLRIRSNLAKSPKCTHGTSYVDALSETYR